MITFVIHGCQHLKLLSFFAYSGKKALNLTSVLFLPEPSVDESDWNIDFGLIFARRSYWIQKFKPFVLGPRRLWESRVWHRFCQNKMYVVSRGC